jgi:hypothetical protein
MFFWDVLTAAVMTAAQSVINTVKVVSTRVMAFLISMETLVLVNREGTFFGYFTINKYRSDAVPFAASLKEIFEAAQGDLEVVRNLICNRLQ